MAYQPTTPAAHHHEGQQSMGALTGSLQVKHSRALLDLWYDAEVSFDPPSEELVIADPQGRPGLSYSRYVIGCRPVPHATGRRAHRFDILVAAQPFIVACAAPSEGARDEWMRKLSVRGSNTASVRYVHPRVARMHPQGPGAGGSGGGVRVNTSVQPPPATPATATRQGNDGSVGVGGYRERAKALWTSLRGFTYGEGLGSAGGVGRARAAQAVPREQLEQFVTSDVKRQLLQDGYVVIRGVVAPELVDNARKMINRALGDFSAPRSNRNPTPQMSQNTPLGRALRGAVADLYNKSPFHAIIAELLGPTHQANNVWSGQVALRFPGDFCDDDMQPSPHWHKGWHIDGLENPGLIGNFSALCGVILSDVAEPLNGELVVNPGSHRTIAQYFASSGFDAALNSNQVTPPGLRLDFPRSPAGVLGKPGDIVIANYLVAHTIAPNTGPNIRYACYFRVHSTQFPPHDAPGNRTRFESLLDPWVDWVGLQRFQEQEREDDDLTRALAESFADAGVSFPRGPSTAAPPVASEPLAALAATATVPPAAGPGAVTCDRSSPPSNTATVATQSEEEQLRVALALSVYDS